MKLETLPSQILDILKQQGAAPRSVVEQLGNDDNGFVRTVALHRLATS